MRFALQYIITRIDCAAIPMNETSFFSVLNCTTGSMYGCKHVPCKSFWGLRSKERQRNGIFDVLHARKIGREPKKGKRERRGGRGGVGGEGRKRLQTNPWVSKSPLTSERDSPANVPAKQIRIGWASPILLTCVDQRS